MSGVGVVIRIVMGRDVEVARLFAKQQQASLSPQHK